MSVDGQFHSLGAGDWVEQLREARQQGCAPLQDVLDAAYEANEIDSATMFAYFEGRLTEEERRDVEAEAALSPHALNKMARVAAIVAESRGSATAKVASPAMAPEPISAQHAASQTQRVTHRVKLGPPRPSIGSHMLPRSEDCVRSTPDSPCEFYRSLEKDRDQVRIFHQSAAVGTLVGLWIREPNAEGDVSHTPPAQFAVLRMSSESSTTTTLTIPDSFGRGEVILEVVEIPPAALTAQDGRGILNSYERAAIEDPVAVTPLHEPRSAWQIWAEEILNTPEVDRSVREAAELIAAST